MRKLVAVLFIFLGVFLFSTTAEAALAPAPDAAEEDLTRMFDEHGAMLLLVEQKSGNILYANAAAASFYGYPMDQLLSMKISEINLLTSEQFEQERLAAASEERNYFTFEHRLANGDLRTVEVYSYPTQYHGTPALLSIIHDVTAKVVLEKEHYNLILILGVVGVGVLAGLLCLLIILYKKVRAYARAKEELENFNELRETFINADTSFVFLKDEHLKYVFVNKALKNLFQRPYDEIIGHDDFELVGQGFAEMYAKTDLNALEQHQLITSITTWDNRFFHTTKFPVRMPNGTFGVGAYISDITEEYALAQSRERMLKSNSLLLELLTRSFHSKYEQLDYALHELLALSGSQYGYIYFYDEEKQEFTLNSWTKGVMAECTVQDEPKIYQLANTGIWGEVVRQRSPIIVNDFAKPDPKKKGYPEGHVHLKRFMSIPVLIDDKIVATVGFANKETDYDDTDVAEMTMLMSGVWNAVQRRASVETLAYERNKYLQTLLSIGDGVMVIDRNQNIEMLNMVACQLTGWPLAEARGRHYKEILLLSHENVGFTVDDPIEKVFLTGKMQELGNHALLTSRSGAKYHLEDSAAPIMDDKASLAGVVLVFRDVTEKKEQRRKIEYMSFHDSLTGLYNRRFFEEELHRIDTQRNLPISILMGDVNSLKLINDIFSHAFGDRLLERVAEVMQSVCRNDDIIARWGGDEFVLLLPKTSLEEAGRIAERIKQEVSMQQIRSIRCSISIGYDTKEKMSEDLIQTLNNSEVKMYSAKTLERNDIKTHELDAIIDSLARSSRRESEHALRVSSLCQALGRALQLPESDVQMAMEAGRLHDIGKIVLDPALLRKGHSLDITEWREMSQHPIVGYRILNSFYDTMELAEAVLSHHENWDGSGYPKGLYGEKIPLLGRMIAVVESYDRMVHVADRGRVKSSAEAIAEIRRCAGTQFDPVIVEAFVKMLEAQPCFVQE